MRVSVARTPPEISVICVMLGEAFRSRRDGLAWRPYRGLPRVAHEAGSPACGPCARRMSALHHRAKACSSTGLPHILAGDKIMTTDGRGAAQPYRVRVGNVWYWVDPTVPANAIEPGDTVVIYPVAGEITLAIVRSPFDESQASGLSRSQHWKASTSRSRGGISRRCILRRRTTSRHRRGGGTCTSAATSASSAPNKPSGEGRHPHAPNHHKWAACAYRADCARNRAISQQADHRHRAVRGGRSDRRRHASRRRAHVAHARPDRSWWKTSAAPAGLWA